MGWMDCYMPEEKQNYFEVADGDHRVRILNVQNEQSKQGKRMHHVSLQVEGGNMLYDFFIVEGEYYNQTMTGFFDGFHIQRGNFAFDSWRNKEALAHFDHKEQEYTDKQGVQKKINKARLVYFHKNQTTVGTGSPVNVQNTYTNNVQPNNGGNFQENIPF